VDEELRAEVHPAEFPSDGLFTQHRSSGEEAEVNIEACCVEIEKLVSQALATLPGSGRFLN
jgi:hypothetical protein